MTLLPAASVPVVLLVLASGPVPAGPPRPGLSPRQEAEAIMSLQGGARLADGGFPVRVPGVPGAVRASVRPPRPLLLQRLREGSPAALAPLVSPLSTALPRPEPGGSVSRALGDTLVLSLDDGFDPPFEDTYEAALRIPGGSAGPSDWAVARFPSRSLAVGPPFRVADVRIGFDNLRGAAVWPAVELRVEDPAAPLAPRAGAAPSSVSDFDAASLLSPLPAGATRPTDFQRLSLGMPPLDVAAAWLSDGGRDDDFAGSDRPLQNPLSDWTECQDDLCGDKVVGQEALFVTAGGVDRAAPGAASLAVRFQSEEVERVRPALDLDQRVSVDLDLSDPNATRAGVAVRVSASNTFYGVEYIKSTDQIVVVAVVGGVPSLLDTLQVPPPRQTDTPSLTVTVTGTSPQVDIAVEVGGFALRTVSDTTFRLSGTLTGLLATDATSSGERWSAYRMERRPDVFVAIQFPPGGWGALPVDVSEDSVVSSSLLLSSGGDPFALRTEAMGCVNPGNPFVQLEVEDNQAGDRLFEREAHLVSLGVECPTCPTGRNRCFENVSADERQLPVYLINHDLTVTAGWWNEHLDDADDLMLQATVFDVPCDALDSGGNMVAQDTVAVGPDPGQRNAPPAIHTADVTTFQAAVAGTHCVILQEMHAGGDSNPVPAYVHRDIEVYDFDPAADCKAPGEDNLKANSLRVSKEMGDVLSTTLTWEVEDTGIFPATYNVLVMPAEPFSPIGGYYGFGPVWGSVVGELSRTYDLPAPADGRPLWIGVFETDGCPTADSLPD